MIFSVPLNIVSQLSVVLPLAWIDLTPLPSGNDSVHRFVAVHALSANVEATGHPQMRLVDRPPIRYSVGWWRYSHDTGMIG